MPARRLCLHDKAPIEAFLRRNVYLHLYSLGDLDEHAWPHTTWYGLAADDGLKAVALVYSAFRQPIVLALGDEAGLPFVQELLRSLIPLLPRSFYAHLSPGVGEVLEGPYRLVSPRTHYKMALTAPQRLAAVDTSRVEKLTQADLDDLLALYAASYPATSFEPAMLRLGHYYGLRGERGPLSAAGVHVFSEPRRVAALGNIATRPEHRGKGYAKAVVARLCTALSASADHIGLNVRADNAAAIACYQRLGFTPVATYLEAQVTAQP